jgi:predicted RNA-binding protein YlxR (DUF448 family)
LAKPRRIEREDEGPERTCIVTRERRAPEAMVRFVLAPDGAVTPDVRRKLPGRGVWVSCSARHVEAAVRRQAFGRAFKAPARAPDSLPNDVERLLEQDALQGLAIANKAGLVAQGFAKVEAALAKSDVLALIHASDAGHDGVRKLDRLALQSNSGEQSAIERVMEFSSSQLDLALGRSNVIHAAVRRGAAGEFFLSRSRRLAAFRGHGLTAAATERLADGQSDISAIRSANAADDGRRSERGDDAGGEAATNG